MEEAGISPNHLNLVGDFDMQVQHIMETVRLTKQQVDHLHLLYIHLERALCTKWPGCKVIPFGSIVTGLGIRTSDIDCYVDIPEGCHGVDNSSIVMIARNILRKQHQIFEKPFAIAAAKVPIVKFYHIPTGFHCDVNFKSPSGVRNSRLIESLLNFDKRALTLAVLIKYWAKVHKLTGTNLISNYALTMLVIFYLQQVNILPPVCDLQGKHEMFTIDCWNTAINDNIILNFKSDNCMSMFQLLGGFFKYYSSLNFDENIISLFAGHLIPRISFKSVDSVPGLFDLYIDNIISEVCKPLNIDSKICIQDPFEHNRNCTLSVFPKLAMTLISNFQLAARIQDENKKNNYIVDILYKKAPSVQTTKKNRGANKFNKSIAVAAHTSNKTSLMNGKIIKPNNKTNKLLKNSLTVLYQQINKAEKEKERL